MEMIMRYKINGTSAANSYNMLKGLGRPAAATINDDFTINGLAGNDRIFGANGADWIYGGTGNDYLNGGNGDDILQGDAGNDTLIGGNGNDTLNESAGVNTLNGGAGFDTFNLTGGNNTAFGGANNDTFNVTGGTATLDGGAGSDLFNVGVGLVDVMDSGDAYVDSGSDQLRIIANSTVANMPLIIDLVEETWTNTLTNETKSLIGVDNFVGDNLAQGATIIGNGLSTLLAGGNGDDVVIGGANTSVISGGAGNDILIGGLQADILDGGSGADVFKYLSKEEVAGDQIWFFSQAEGDKIDLSGIDANELLTGNQAFTFIGTQNFSGAAGELRYEIFDAGYGNPQNLITIFGDTDGVPGFDFQIAMRFETPESMVNFVSNDFIL
jgi:serralysin